MLLAHLEELFKTQATVAVRIVHLEDRLGESFRQIGALRWAILDQPVEFSNLQITVMVCIILKQISPFETAAINE